MNGGKTAENQQTAYRCIIPPPGTCINLRKHKQVTSHNLNQSNQQPLKIIIIPYQTIHIQNVAKLSQITRSIILVNKTKQNKTKWGIRIINQ